jgi:hypothetical protein
MIKAGNKWDFPLLLKTSLGVLIILVILIGSWLFTLRGFPETISMLPIIHPRSPEYGQKNVGGQVGSNARLVETAGGSRAAGPLRVSTENPRYFTDGSGNVVFLAGSHTWLNLQDGVLTDPPPEFDYPGWLNFLQQHNHNFFRLWVWEQSKWSVEGEPPYFFSPHPFQRTGPDNAQDGKLKFDLTRLNQAYFDRMRERVIQAGDKGIYVSIMLFNGWSPYYPKGQYSASNPWNGHPFNLSNNINGIDGDPNKDGSGDEIHELTVPEITALQEAYVRKVIDTVNDLDNVLYEISNESIGSSASIAWQNHFIDFIHTYEAGKAKQHPVGFTVPWPNGNNADPLASNADWISPNGGLDNPPPTDGSKVIISDTDHLCGICGDRAWVWKSFTRGYNLLFMDQYDDSYKLHGGGYDMNNPNDVSLRDNLGYTALFVRRLNLNEMEPHGELSSSGYALANPNTIGAEYLVYLPEGSTVTNILNSVGIDRSPDIYLPTDRQVLVDLSATPGELKVEWFNPKNGITSSEGTVTGGGIRTFTAPFSGDAVLYLFQEAAEKSFKIFYPSIFFNLFQ